MGMAEAPFMKHVYSRERKRTMQSLEDFDPRPTEFRGTVRDRLPGLLGESPQGAPVYFSPL